MPDSTLTVERLLGVVSERDAVIGELRARIVELERRLGQNSKNSSLGAVGGSAGTQPGSFRPA